MFKRRALIHATAVAAFALNAPVVCSQSYPTHLVRIVSGEPGGGTGFAARLVAQGLTAAFGQQVIVENRGGASGAISVQTVAKSPPDGHTLLLNGSQIWMLPLMQADVSYDPVRDLAPVCYVTRQPNILTVHPSLPVQSVRELTDLAKKHPGRLNYGAGSSGSSTHLSAELYKMMATLDIVRISYKGTGPALTDLLAGQVQIMFGITSAVSQHIRAGKLRGLAVTSAQPSALAPGLPTMAQSGLAGYESVAAHAIFAPARTPLPVIQRLNAEIKRYIDLPEIRERLLSAGIEPVASSPEELASLVASDTAKWGKVIRAAGIKAD
jgi:tripartite-type tricarboxylate transporter receptor subunit TctC